MRHGSGTRGFSALAISAALVTTLAACGSDDDPIDGADVEVITTDVAGAVDSAADEVDDSATDLAQALRDNGLDTAAGIVEQVDVSEFVDEDFTFFAPSDEAFTTLDADYMADLLADPAMILDVLRNHTLTDTVSAQDLAGLTEVESEAGETLTVTVDGDTVMLDDVTVTSTDIEVGEGVIHVVDGFLIVQ